MSSASASGRLAGLSDDLTQEEIEKWSTDRNTEREARLAGCLAGCMAIGRGGAITRRQSCLRRESKTEKAESTVFQSEPAIRPVQSVVKA